MYKFLNTCRSRKYLEILLLFVTTLLLTFISINLSFPVFEYLDGSSNNLIWDAQNGNLTGFSNASTNLINHTEMGIIVGHKSQSSDNDWKEEIEEQEGNKNNVTDVSIETVIVDSDNATHKKLIEGETEREEEDELKTPLDTLNNVEEREKDLFQQASEAIKNKNQELANKGFSQIPNEDTKTPLFTAKGDGYYQFFRDGHGIWWSKDTGAHEVHGEILKKWRELNFENGKMGFPLSDELSGDNGAKYNQFQNGFIIWTQQSGAYESDSLNFARFPIIEDEKIRTFYVAFNHLNIFNTRDDIGPGDWCLFASVNGKSVQLLSDTQVPGGYQPLGGYLGKFDGSHVSQYIPTIKAYVAENEDLHIHVWGEDNDFDALKIPSLGLGSTFDGRASAPGLSKSESCQGGAYETLPEVDVRFSKKDNWGIKKLGLGDQVTHTEEAQRDCDKPEFLGGPGEGYCWVDYEI
jgi:hypothetical protein